MNIISYTNILTAGITTYSHEYLQRARHHLVLSLANSSGKWDKIRCGVAKVLMAKSCWKYCQNARFF